MTAVAKDGAAECQPADVHCVGLVLSDPCGMRDHGTLLAGELRRRGLTVVEEWHVNDGAQLGRAVTASWRLLRSARRPAAGSTVIWHYSSFGCAWRGVSLFGVLLGVLLRWRRVSVVTFLHEPALPWNRRLDRRAVVALSQWLALRLAIAGSSVLVVTTDQRSSWLRRRTSREVHVVPVFSNIPVTPDVTLPVSSSGPTFTLGVVGYVSDGVDPSLLFEALRRLEPAPAMRVLLVGGPGPAAPGAEAWRRVARDADLGEQLEFTGVLSPSELSRCLQACDLVAFLDKGGPSSRKGTLAAALAHGRPIVAVDGPERWGRLAEAGAVRLAPAEPAGLALALDELARSSGARSRLGEAAAAFYAEHMALAQAADRVVPLLAGEARSRVARRHRAAAPGAMTGAAHHTSPLLTEAARRS